MGRFINADIFISTGQGILGNNMLVYCGNNPVQYSDSNGYRYVADLRADFMGKYSWQEVVCNLIDDYKALEKPQIAGSAGKYLSVTLGVFNVSATKETAIDTHGNIQRNSSFSFDVTTAGALSISTGYTGSVFLVPDVSFLAGDTTYIGGGVAVPIPSVPIAATGSINVGQTSDGYMGLMLSGGVAPVSSAGGEIHAGYSYTHSWSPAINILDLIHCVLD